MDWELEKQYKRGSFSFSLDDLSKRQGLAALQAPQQRNYCPIMLTVFE
jgi:hypothetical protein